MIISYRAGEDVGRLESWPFTGAASDYVVTRGEPRASGRLDGGGPGFVWRAGIWRCTAGTFMCNELGDEMQTVLSGRVRLTLPDGSSHEFTAGDTLFTRRGDRVTWDVIEDVTKAFFTINPDGF
ncbi:MAG: cupin domain-containing protein [Rhodospirillales bacterium]